MFNEDPTGGQLIAVSHRALWWAVDIMVKQLAPEKLSELRIRSGEHLAAILTTAYLGVAPTDIDTEGDVDLWFDLSETQSSIETSPLPLDVSYAAFEVKSMTGPYRKWTPRIEQDESRGLDATGSTLHGTVRAANDA